ncbi:MAG: hypothetical protein V7632_231 [Bradyrhizobium sp.]|jgi:hypothetical protein
MEYLVADGVAVCSDEGGDPYNLIVTDLVALIGHIQASLRLIETAIARESVLAEQDEAADIFILDDVTPRYTAASAALMACDAGLAAALEQLCEFEGPARLLN